jgi:ribosome biogenesis SPOUT family RNA methylase Rps3
MCDIAPLDKIQFIDHPEIKLRKKETVTMPFRYIALPPKESTEVAAGVEGEESTKKSKKAKKLEPLLPPGMLELLKKDNDTALDLF